MDAAPMAHLGRFLLSVHWAQSDNVPSLMPSLMRGLLVCFSFSTPNPYQMVKIFPPTFGGTAEFHCTASPPKRGEERRAKTRNKTRTSFSPALAFVVSRRRNRARDNYGQICVLGPWIITPVDGAALAACDIACSVADARLRAGRVPRAPNFTPPFPRELGPSKRKSGVAFPQAIIPPFVCRPPRS